MSEKESEKMTDREKSIKEQAKLDRLMLGRRMGLLHISYARTLVDELGEEEGKRLILKAIKRYGTKLGEKRKKGIQHYPTLGTHEKTTEDGMVFWEDGVMTTYGCTIGLESIDQGEPELGALYCYVDPVQTMIGDPESKKKMIHTKVIQCDGICQFALVPITEQEQKDVADINKDLDPDIDPHLWTCKPKKD
jgi:hypothetical protein